MKTVLAVLVALALVPSALGQRKEASFEWQKRSATFTYGVPRVGKHSIDELKVGETWRMGSGPITTLTVEAPLVADNFVIPPGVYRVNLARPEAQKFELTIEGAGSGLAAGGDDVKAPATYGDAKKANEALELLFEVAAAAPAPPSATGGALVEPTLANDPEAKPLQLVIQFGAPRVVVPLTIVGTQPLKAKGFAVDAFKFEERWLGRRLELAKATPILSLTRSGKLPDGVPARLNLLLSEKTVVLTPALVEPTENNGFGVIPKPDAAWILDGTVAWSDAPARADHLHVVTNEIDKDGILHVVADLGARRATIAVATTPKKSDKK